MTIRNATKKSGLELKNDKPNKRNVIQSSLDLTNVDVTKIAILRRRPEKLVGATIYIAYKNLGITKFDLTNFSILRTVKKNF